MHGTNPRKHLILLTIFIWMAVQTWQAIPQAVAFQNDLITQEIDDEFEDEIDDELEDEFEDIIEDELEDEFEDELEDLIEDEIEDEFEDVIEDELEDEFEDIIEDEIEDEFEDVIEDELEDEFEDIIEDEIEDEFEDVIEGELEDEFEDIIEDEIEDEFEDVIEDELEDEFEDIIEDEIEDEFEDVIEDELDDEFDEFIEDEIDDEFEDFIDDEVSDEVEFTIEDDLGDEFDEEIFDDMEDEFESEFEEEFDEEFFDDEEFLDEDEFVDEEFMDDEGFFDDEQMDEESIDEELEDDELEGEEFEAEELEDEDLPELDGQVDDLTDRIVETAAEAADLELELIVDARGREALSNEWIVLAEPQSLIALQNEGYVIQKTESLDALGYVLGTIQAPKTFDPSSSQITGLEVLNSPTIAVDTNSVYRPALAQPSEAPTSLEPSANVTAVQPIGMIDSAIDQSHEVFVDAQITEATFNPEGYALGLNHGTAIASLMIGNSATYQGYSTGAQLYNGAVFSEDPNGSEFSTVVAVVRALNWLMSNDVRLINMSLAGPDNTVLRKAIESACGNNATVVAAVGNAGPMAEPLFPAAYDCTVGITAVDNEDEPFYRALRGNHVDFAGPGVRVRHASPGGFSRSTGTSFATAYVTSVLASLPVKPDAKTQLINLAEDKGEPGKDPVFGHGVVRALGLSR